MISAEAGAGGRTRLTEALAKLPMRSRSRLSHRAVCTLAAGYRLGIELRGGAGWGMGAP